MALKYLSNGLHFSRCRKRSTSMFVAQILNFLYKGHIWIYIIFWLYSCVISHTFITYSFLKQQLLSYVLRGVILIKHGIDSFYLGLCTGKWKSQKLETSITPLQHEHMHFLSPIPRYPPRLFNTQLNEYTMYDCHHTACYHIAICCKINTHCTYINLWCIRRTDMENRTKIMFS